MSHFETRLDNSYRERADPALTVGLQLCPAEPSQEAPKLLVWTTTPWTLPSNLAIAMGPEIEYAVVQSERFGLVILALEAVERYARELGAHEVVSTSPGSAWAGRRYQPLFPYFADTRNAFQVLLGTFVSADDGTGIVHMAPGFGEDDLAVCQAAGIPVVVPVDDAGRFTDAVPDYAGLNVIYEGNPRVIRDLKARSGVVVRHEQVLHDYPHCWRTDEPLIYRAINSWFVAVTKFKDRMVELNHCEMNWSPDTVRDGQFGKWLENARDWNISRNRFWGSPVPVWQSDDPAHPRTEVYGSVAEIEAAFGVEVKDLHRPAIDLLVRPNPDDPTGRSMMRRVPDVLDCWFESGSMPFAQLHYPFENQERFERNFPGDFIVEYIAQTRGWFYTLMVLSTSLFDRAPFRNCICHGVVLGDDNQKQSKRLKNYPDPVDVFRNHGSDALRWFMLASPLMGGGNLAMARDGSDIGKTSRSVLLRFWNAYVFFTLYANVDRAKCHLHVGSPHSLDRYILAKTRLLVSTIQDRMEAYDLRAAYESVPPYIEALNNWYIRNRRDRFWADWDDDPEDKRAAYDTLYTCLVLACRALAPLMPIITERIYTALVGVEGAEGSVHLSDWPDVTALPQDDGLIRRMELAREVCSAVLGVREALKRRTRLPLARLVVAHPEQELLASLVGIIAEEVNVKSVALTADLSQFGRPEIRVHPSLGKVYGAKMQAVFAAQRSGEWTMSEDGQVSIGDVVLEPSQYQLRIRAKTGEATGSFDNGRGVIALDTDVTPELQAEGWARDVVRLVQNARKQQHFKVTDRICLEAWAEEPVRSALLDHREYISRETLAAHIDVSAVMTDPGRDTVSDDLDGHGVRLRVSRLPL